MGIYLKSGYVDIKKILHYNLSFNFVCGGRGTGKTYGALKYVIENNVKFMLMRRTQAQCDLISRAQFNPFKTVARDLGIEIEMKSISQYNSAFFLDGEQIGYTCALSTISNMRGFDSSEVELLIYDEFIPERHERSIKDEDSAFFNAYETVNRNRELKGEKPLQVLCLANANNLNNAIFTSLSLIDTCLKMEAKDQELYINRNRGVLIALLNESRISRQKAQTALYTLTGENNYTEMALNNDFVYNDYSDIHAVNLREYYPYCAIGDICIYRHKSKNWYHVSSHYSGTPPTYEGDNIGQKRYNRTYGMRLYTAYLNGRITFENGLTKSYFELYTI